jgi:3-deoxy-7-phosphoheptulonate synthase
MQNFILLKEAGKSGKPILLKRGMSATLEEFLLAAEYILAQGNDKLILCERGIRTFEEYTRNTFALNVIPMVKKVSHLPIIADPSHATGRSDLVVPMSRAAIAAGADGLIVEVHPNPAKALVDGPQSLNLSQFEELIKECQPIASVLGRKI